MSCDWVRDNIALFIYDELPDDARFEMERHVDRCPACRQELEEAREFRGAMSAFPIEEMPADFLTANRMALEEALEHAPPPRRGWDMFLFDFTGLMQQIKLAPALTAALLMAGFAAGVATTYEIVGRNSAPPKREHAAFDASITGIESIAPEPNSNRVAITYDTLTPQTMVGEITNPAIHKLLLLACQNNRNSDVRLGGIEILKNQSEDNAVREALAYALRYDRNPGVRLKALDGLKGYVKDDVHVRDAVLEALLHDSNAGVRSKAMGLLEEVKADSSVHEALEVLAERDPNKFIRSESKRYLASTPNLD